MPKILTRELDASKLSFQQKLWVYNALDSAVTLEISHALKSQMDEVAKRTYEFSLSLQAPVLSMMRFGFRVNPAERAAAIREFEDKADFLLKRLNLIAFEVWGKPLNPNSPKQVNDFFYRALKLPVQRKKNKQTGEYSETSDRGALETLESYFNAALPVRHIMAIRELKKLASTLKSEVEKDGRMRTSFNIAGTETGRFSSSSSAFSTGTNLQNQTERLRRVYVADPGYKLGVFDLKTGESFAVGLKCHLLGLGRAYLDACSSGDLHTSVCKLVWPGLEWTGDPKLDKAIAEQIFYRHFSYRDMAKRGGHGTNYYGTPWTMAKHLKVDVKLIEVFQQLYFSAFPEIPEWHLWVAGQIQAHAQLTSIFGRRRHFFGRTRDDNTLREAIAYDPQSCIADYTNTWLLRVYQNVRKCQLLLQGHDALVVQFREGDEHEVVEGIIAQAQTVRLGGDHPDSITIPAEAKVGWNWGKEDPKKKMHKDGNPFGLRDYTGKDDRKYQPPTSSHAQLLDRRFS